MAIKVMNVLKLLILCVCVCELQNERAHNMLVLMLNRPLLQEFAMHHKVSW
jgi:hypothetical protein